MGRGTECKMQRPPKHEKICFHLMVYCWTFLESMSTLCLVPSELSEAQHKACQQLRSSDSQGRHLSHTLFTLYCRKPTLSCPSHNANLPSPFLCTTLTYHQLLENNCKFSNNVARTGQILWPGLGIQHY